MEQCSVYRCQPGLISGIILAGGSSRRMGVNKLMLPWGSGTLLSHAIRTVKACSDDVWVVGDEISRSITEQQGVHFFSDECQSGPLMAILEGLRVIKRNLALVMAADLPFIDRNVIDAICGLAGNADVTVIRTDDGAHPLFGVYSKKCIPVIQSLIDADRYRIVDIWPHVHANVIDVGRDHFWKHHLCNINSPEDYEAALKQNFGS